MGGNLKQLWTGCRGTAAIEFALISPILFGMVLGTVEYGRYIWIEKTIQHGIEDAARYGSFEFRAKGPSSNSAIVSYAQSQMTSVPGATVTVVFKKNAMPGIDVIEVSAQYKFDPIIPGITKAGKWTINAKAVQPI
jgi:Flp pilus assembly protein TadG